MKKIKKSLIFVSLITFLVMATTSIAKADVTSTVSVTPTKVESATDFKVTVKFSEAISGADGYIDYTNNSLTFSEETSTANLSINPEESTGKLAFMYAPMDGKTTSDTLVFNAKAGSVTSSKTIECKLSDVEIIKSDSTRSKIADTSFTVTIEPKSETESESQSTDTESTESTTAGSTETKSTSETTASTSKSTSTKKLAKTGESEFIVIAIIAAIAVAVSSKYKSNKMKKLFVMLPVLVAVSIAGGCVSKADEVATEPLVDVFDMTLSGEKVLCVSPRTSYTANSSEQKLTVDVIRDALTVGVDGIDQISVVGPEGEISTGDSVTININGTEETKKVILYGDATGEGEICRITDIQYIINDFLGIKNSEADMYKTEAADIYSDNRLSVADAYRMVKKKINKMEDIKDYSSQGTLVTRAPAQMGGKIFMSIDKTQIYVDDDDVATLKVGLLPYSVAKAGIDVELGSDALSVQSKEFVNGVWVLKLKANAPTQTQAEITIKSKVNENLATTLIIEAKNRE